MLSKDSAPEPKSQPSSLISRSCIRIEKAMRRYAALEAVAVRPPLLSSFALEELETSRTLLEGLCGLIIPVSCRSPGFLSPTS